MEEILELKKLLDIIFQRDIRLNGEKNTFGFNMQSATDKSIHSRIEIFYRMPPNKCIIKCRYDIINQNKCYRIHYNPETGLFRYTISSNSKYDYKDITINELPYEVNFVKIAKRIIYYLL